MKKLTVCTSGRISLPIIEPPALRRVLIDILPDLIDRGRAVIKRMLNDLQILLHAEPELNLISEVTRDMSLFADRLQLLEQNLSRLRDQSLNVRELIDDSICLLIFHFPIEDVEMRTISANIMYRSACNDLFSCRNCLKELIILLMRL